MASDRPCASVETRIFSPEGAVVFWFLAAARNSSNKRRRAGLLDDITGRELSVRARGRNAAASGRSGRHRMRVATICVVLIIHVVFFILFAALRSPLPRAGQEEEPSMAFFLPPDEVDTAAEVAPQSPTRAQAARRPIPKRAAAATARSPDAIVRPEPEPPPSAITVPAAPDWRHEMQIAANNAIEAEERKRHQPSPPATGESELP